MIIYFCFAREQGGNMLEKIKKGEKWRKIAKKSETLEKSRKMEKNSKEFEKDWKEGGK